MIFHRSVCRLNVKTPSVETLRDKPFIGWAVNLTKISIMLMTLDTAELNEMALSLFN